jgi:hypothetical protein
MARQTGIVRLGPSYTTDGATLTAAALGEASPTPALVLAQHGPLEQHQRFEFNGWGRITTAATPGTGVLGIYVGAVAIASGQGVIVSAALALKASMTTVTWRIEGNFQITAIGTAGGIRGVAEISNLTTNGTDMAPATAPTAVTVDTTANNVIRLGWTPSLATATFICHDFGVRSVN